MTYATTLKRLAILFLILAIPTTALAEEAEGDDAVADKYAQYLSGDQPDFEDEPVRDTFGDLMVINTPTVQQMKGNALGFTIQHRFGEVSSKFEDLFGVYAPANIRIGLNYGITDWLQVGFGTTKFGSNQDLNYRVNILQQSEDGSMPISLTYYGQGTLQAGPAEMFDSFMHRMAYNQQLLIARKFGNYFSLQLAPSFSHFNIVDEAAGYRHDNFGISVIGKVMVSSTASVVFEAGQGQLLYSPEDGDSKPVLGLGFEMVTSGHGFQVFVSSTNQIISHQASAYNPNDITEGQLFVGFNMTRNWNF